MIVGTAGIVPPLKTFSTPGPGPSQLLAPKRFEPPGQQMTCQTISNIAHELRLSYFFYICTLHLIV